MVKKTRTFSLSRPPILRQPGRSKSFSKEDRSFSGSSTSSNRYDKTTRTLRKTSVSSAAFSGITVSVGTMTGPSPAGFALLNRPNILSVRWSFHSKSQNVAIFQQNPKFGKPLFSNFSLRSFFSVLIQLDYSIYLILKKKSKNRRFDSPFGIFNDRSGIFSCIQIPSVIC